MADSHDAAGGDAARTAAAPSPPFTFLDMPCDLISCLGPVACTPGYAEEMDGMQCLCRAARDDAMLGAATADLRYQTQSVYGPFTRLQYVCRMNDEARVQWLVECGARGVLAAAERGYTGAAALVRRLALHPLVDPTEALVAAACTGLTDLVAPLLARGAQLERAVRGPDPDCEPQPATALHAASFGGHLATVTAPLIVGAAVDGGRGEDGTALHFAAAGGSLEAVQALLAAGADVNWSDANGETAADWAVTAESEATAAYLCRLPDADPGAHIVVAAWLGDVALARSFLARGAGVEERNVWGETCLMLAARRDHVEVARVLLDAGADMADSLTSGLGHPAIMALLLERLEVGGDAERQAALNRTLHVAALTSKPEFVESMRQLLVAGADVNAREEPRAFYIALMPAGGRVSALSMAAMWGNVAAFRLLLDAGADVAGLDLAASPEEEIRKCCSNHKDDEVPLLLAALADAATGGRCDGGGGAAAEGSGGAAR
jgi:ankyrin repeat protein